MTSNIQFPEDCPAWLAGWISRADERLGNIETTLERFETTLVRLVKRGVSKNNDNPKTKDSDKVTFKWLVEKVVVPAMLLGAGYYIGRGG